MNYPWQATVQDEQGNAVVNPVVTVWEADGVTLATIYDVTGAAIPNPITGSLEGFVQFWTSAGSYIIEGAKAGEETEPWHVIIGGVDSGSILVGAAVTVSGIDVRGTTDLITTSGYHSDGDGGAASYRRVALEPSHAGKLQSADGSWWEISGSSVNVKQFGAFGDGVADESDAFNGALVYSGDVFIPAGDYFIGSQVSVSGRAVNIKGAGVGISVLHCGMPTDDMIVFTPTSGDHFFDIGGFSCVSTAAGVTSGAAIVIDGSSQLTTDTYKGMFVTGEREKRRGIISNIDFLPNGSFGSFGYGVRIKCLLNFKMSDMTFTGASDAFALEAFAIEGQGVPVDIRANNLYAYNCQFGLRMPDYVEALYLRDSEFINVLVGIENKYVSGRSVVGPEVAERSNSMKIGPFHTSSKGPVAIDVQGADYMVLRDTLFIMQDGIQPQKVCINIDGGNMMKISGNQFVSTLGTTSNAGAMFCIAGSRVSNSQMCDNTANGVNEVFHLSNSSVSNLISGNINMSSGVGVILVTTDSNSVSNIIKDNNGDAPNIYVMASLNNVIGTVTYAKRFVASLPSIGAGGYTDYTFSAPSNMLKGIPTMAKLESENGDANLVGSLLYTSTNNVWNFRIYNRAKASVGAGDYNLVVYAVSMTG